MATKEEHLWRLLQAARNGKPEIDMFRWAEAAADLDAAREELATLKVDGDIYNAGRREGWADISCRLRAIMDPDDREHWNIDGVLAAVAKLKAAQPSAEAAVHPGDPRHVALWDAINAYGAAGGGGPNISGARMDAVAAVEEALRDYLKAAQPSPALDLAAWIAEQRDFSLATFGPGARTRGVVAHIRKELAEVEADPDGISEWIDVVILALDGAWRAGHEPREIADALRAKLDINKARTWPDWRTMPQDGPIEHDRSGEQPSPAPVVGGVTELMLDEIQHLVDQYPYCPGVDEKASTWLTSARAAIRAQKRVDVEAIREVALKMIDNGFTGFGRRLLWAISDEPAAAPVAEPAAPAQEGLTFTRRGCRIYSNGFDWLRLAYGSSEANADEALRLLNLGIEAEKLRARVAELERIHRLPEIERLDREHQRQLARADAAEKRVAELTAQLESDSNALTETRDQMERQILDLEAKLAALGENPIPRERVERWRDARSANFDVWQALVQILAGREPGVAS